MERKEFLNLVGMSVGAIVLQNCISGCSSKSDPTPAVIPPNQKHQDYLVISPLYLTPQVQFQKNPSCSALYLLTQLRIRLVKTLARTK